MSKTRKFKRSTPTTTFLGTLLLLGGLFAGLTLVSTPQYFEQKAARLQYDSCGKSECDFPLNDYKCQTFNISNVSYSAWYQCVTIKGKPGCPNINVYVQIKSCGEVEGCTRCTIS